MRDWLKLAGREGAEKVGKAERLWRVGTSEKVGFKARKKLIAERESALTGWKEIELMTVVEQCVSGTKDFRLIGREFHKRGDELRNDRSANLSVVETGGRKSHT